MSIFSLPRIHVSGLMEINVGTANNDDYSGSVFVGGPGSGQLVRLADSAAVQPTTFGLSDADFITFVQTPIGTTDAPAAPSSSPLLVPADAQTKAVDVIAPAATAAAAPTVTQTIPAEWNYFGDMGLTMTGVTVQAVDYADHSVVAGQPGADDDPFIGATLSFNNRPDNTGRTTGIICDVTPEDVPMSQMLAGNLMLQRNGQIIFSGAPHKATTRWINFQRNVNLTRSAGASAVFQHAVPLAALAGQPILDVMPRFDSNDRPLIGLVFRYVLFRTIPPINPSQFKTNDGYNTAILALYATKGTNPGIAQLTGTIAPWYEGDMATLPAGRYLVPTSLTFPPPPNTKGNGGKFQLAPATLFIDQRATGPVAIVDTAGTFPEWYQGNFNPRVTTDNDKYDFGAVSLTLRGVTATYTLGTIPYTNAAAYNACDGIFEFSLNNIPITDITAGSFGITGAAGDYLLEKQYLIASDTGGIYAEQNDGSTPIDIFNNEGDAVPVTMRVFERGVELTASSAPQFRCTVWEYDTTPNQAPTAPVVVAQNFAIGDKLSISGVKTGNRVYTITMPGDPAPPQSYGDLALMTVPLIALRILPNDKDYSSYYDGSNPPVGNASLDFDVIYNEVFRNYYLLYPAMNQQVPLNDASYWQDPVMAGALLQRTQFSQWMQPTYMPRTRDLSGSRRTLIQAWCRKIMSGVTMIALMVGALVSTVTAQTIPYQIAVRPSARQAVPGVQSFALGTSNGLWLVMGGRRNGFHRTSSSESTFPSTFANDSAFVIDPLSNNQWSMQLPASLRDRLSVTNSVAMQDSGILYMIGGYGSTCDNDQPSCYQTYPALTAVNVQQAISAVQRNDTVSFKKYIAVLSDERFRVAGGGMSKLGDDFYLVFGQNYDSIYKGGYTGKYTEQIRRFELSLRGAIIGQSGASGVSVTSYKAYSDPQGGGPASQYHRRDLNVMEFVESTWNPGIAVFGGVFTPQGSAWQQPIFLTASSGDPTIYVDSFTQRMSLYECARVLAFDSSTSTMYFTFLGGISAYFYDSNGVQRIDPINNPLPFISSITTVARLPNQTDVEVTQPLNASLPKLLGSNAQFIPLPSIPRFAGTSDVIDLKSLGGGQEVLIGHMYGGILATASQSSQFNPTFANDVLYDVFLIPVP